MRRPLVAIDFDGTIVAHEYPQIGHDIGAFPWLKNLQASGADLILLTMRHGETLDAAIKFCALQGVTFVSHNCSPNQERWSKSRKVYAHLYIDDAALGVPLMTRAGTDRPFVDWACAGPRALDWVQRHVV